jgi:hypothetical protein
MLNEVNITLLFLQVEKLRQRQSMRLARTPLFHGPARPGISLWAGLWGDKGQVGWVILTSIAEHSSWIFQACGEHLRTKSEF